MQLTDLIHIRAVVEVQPGSEEACFCNCSMEINVIFCKIVSCSDLFLRPPSIGVSFFVVIFMGVICKYKVCRT